MSVPLNLTSLIFFLFVFLPLPFRSKFQCSSLEILHYGPLPLSFYGHWICNYWGPGTLINTLASQILHVCFVLSTFLILVLISGLDSHCLRARVSASCSVQCPCPWRSAQHIMTTQRTFSEWICCALSLGTKLFYKPCSTPRTKPSPRQQCQLRNSLHTHPTRKLHLRQDCPSWVFLSLHIPSALRICQRPCSLCIYLFICPTASHWASVLGSLSVKDWRYSST